MILPCGLMAMHGVTLDGNSVAVASSDDAVPSSVGLVVALHGSMSLRFFWERS